MVINKTKLTFSVISLLITLIFAAIAITVVPEYLQKESQLNRIQIKIRRYDKKAVELNNYAMNLWHQELLKTRPDTKVADRAIQILDSAIITDSSYYTAYTNKTGILCNLDQRLKAIHTMEKSVEKISCVAENFELLGMLYEAAGRKKEAEANYEKALALFEKQFNDKHFLNSRSNQILILKTLGRKAEADKLIAGLSEEFPDKNKEIADFLKFYSNFNRKIIINEIFKLKNK